MHLCDREADDYAFFAEAAALGEHVLVRAAHNRELEEEEEDPAVPRQRLFDVLAEQRAQGRTEVSVQVNEKRKFREATLSVVYRSITVRPPRGQRVEEDGTKRASLPLTAIMAIEREGSRPLGERVCWVLLTDLDVGDVEEAIEKVRWYALRWNIDICQS